MDSVKDSSRVEHLNESHAGSLTPSFRGEQKPIRDVDQLFDALDLPDDGRRTAARRAAGLFGLRVPHHYLDQIRPGDIDDPLLRQILPIEDESSDTGGVPDAVGDHQSSLGHGVLHKYPGRALLITTGACAVHCRYCFRRHFDYADDHAGGSHEDQAIATVAADPTIREVILSGGDPLSLPNARLAALLGRLDAIEHVKTLRLHSRTPIVDPTRLDDNLIDILADCGAQTVLVVHANHPRELSALTEDRLGQAAASGITLLNQAVLLHGVNDEVATLKELSERLFDANVLPYYLHLLDPVTGARHFDVDMARAMQLMEALAGQLPGYLVPKLAKENAGAQSKVTYGNTAQ